MTNLDIDKVLTRAVQVEAFKILSADPTVASLRVQAFLVADGVFRGLVQTEEASTL